MVLSRVGLVGFRLSSADSISLLDTWQNVYLLDARAGFINSDWIALYTSRGFESPALTSFMRKTSLFTDLLIYVPSVIYFLKVYQKDWVNFQTLTLTTLLMPALTIIDHGHFQLLSANEDTTRQCLD
jgi:alpha-1,3-glucosyltransferase